MESRDIELVAKWSLEFHREALPFEPYSTEEATRASELRVNEMRTFLWDFRGSPVAMASLARPTRNTITVNGVYTPPARRKQGHAMRLVAAVSQEGLHRGKKFCVLHTDLNNPTSNSIYQKIGYRRIADSRNCQFIY